MTLSDQPLAVFERNLEYARGMVNGGRALDRLRTRELDPADLYRAAWGWAIRTTVVLTPDGHHRRVGWPAARDLGVGLMTLAYRDRYSSAVPHRVHRVFEERARSATARHVSADLNRRL